MPVIDKLLIANRGEIALRVMRTAHALGISTVAVYSDADAQMPFVRAADEAVGLGGAAARESYLVIDKIVAAAKATGAQAIHPGYGFLSENPLLPEACAAAGIIFVGPSAETIRKLGAKREAKILAAAAGVPTVPGYNGEDQATEAFVRKADELGYPLLLKASAGGGGKGMHVLRGDEGPGGVAEAVERARREAQAAFGDGTLLMERYLERPRHLEVQILGDSHGNLIHLHERECSIQRRHQKILEEAPSPTLAAERRARMGEAAVALGRAVGYVGAGTVEFIADASGAFYFLEVNTRLQVEHPVTELVCGVDLVAEQLRIARGERLRWSEAPPRRGHAIEVRLCAEDPDRDYLPTTGQVVELTLSPDAPVRCDLGVEAGSEIGIHYDSMLGKLIAHADSREEAAGALRRALQHGLIAGVTTNADLLVRLLGHPAFLAAELDTHFLERHAATLQVSAAERAEAAEEAALAATLAGIAERSARRQADAQAQLAGVPLGWHNVAPAPTRVRFRVAGSAPGDKPIEVRYQLRSEQGGGDGALVSIGERSFAAHDLRLVQSGGGPGGLAVEAELELDAASGLSRHRRRWRVAHRSERGGAGSGERTWVAARGQTVALVEEPRFPERVAQVAAGSLLAPMPGKVVKVLVSAGDEVKAGAPIVILEAMKMEHTIRAAADGKVSELRAAVGDQVAADEVLAVVA